MEGQENNSHDKLYETIRVLGNFIKLSDIRCQGLFYELQKLIVLYLAHEMAWSVVLLLIPVETSTASGIFRGKTNWDCHSESGGGDSN